MRFITWVLILIPDSVFLACCAVRRLLYKSRTHHRWLPTLIIDVNDAGESLLYLNVCVVLTYLFSVSKLHHWLTVTSRYEMLLADGSPHSGRTVYICK